ncbi:MAG: GNAT family N-acetyltransferase [Verrucomicrobia bacterium]|nr:GNAT family N-acetyltransferase [Verrucomicrobiota bacterium]
MSSRNFEHDVILPATMILTVNPASVAAVQPWRDMHRLEMPCQIIHDSIHGRPGWTQEYFLFADGVPIGYGSLAIAGPWKDKPTIYEFYVAPPRRQQVFALFEILLAASGAVAIETQSNDPLLTTMLHAFAQNVVSESILFEDRFTTAHAPAEAVFRRATPDDSAQVEQRELDSGAKWLVTVGGAVAAAGDILFHYNRPYGDIYMKVGEPFRRRGVGAYLVQELKRICYEGGNVPAARCNVKNLASRRTLQRAGFVPCGHILTGSVARP